MKSLSLWIGGVLLVANIAILMLLTDCADIITIMTSCAIASTSLLIFTSSMLHIKDGFKVSLPFLFIFNGLVEYILAFFINPEQVKGDGFFIAIILLLLFQILCIILVNAFSRHG